MGRLSRYVVASMLVLGACTSPATGPDTYELTNAAAQELLVMYEGGEPGPRLAGLNSLASDLVWTREQAGTCDEIDWVAGGDQAHAFRMSCERDDLQVHILFYRKQINGVFLWGVDIEPEPGVREAAEALARVTGPRIPRDAEVFHDHVLAIQLAHELPKLEARGACSVDRLVLGGRRYGVFAFECESGGALVRIFIKDGQITILNIDDSGLAAWRHLMPGWMDTVD